MERCPYSDEKPRDQQQRSPSQRNDDMKTGYSKGRIDPRAEQSNTDPHDDDADIVKDAFEKIHGRRGSIFIVPMNTAVASATRRSTKSETPNTLTRSTLERHKPGRKSGGVLFEPLLGVIGKNARGDPAARKKAGHRGTAGQFTARSTSSR
jgi:hypothetical protein